METSVQVFQHYLPLINQTLTRPGAVPLVWTIEDVVQSPSLVIAPGEHSLRLDAQGRAHLAFGGDRLYYAHQDGQSWQQQVVDTTSGSGRCASLALTADDQPRISYIDGRQSALKYAAWTGGRWDIQSVDRESRVAGSTSMALDSAGHAHICYYDESYADENRSTLKYAYWTGSEWQKQIVDPSLSIAGSCSLALNANGVAAIAYYDWREHDLRYAYRSGADWILATVDREGDVGNNPSLAVGQDGSAHISYTDADHNTLKYAHQAGTTWQISSLETEGGLSSLVLDPSGNPVIGFATSGSMQVGATRWDGAAWRDGPNWPLGDGRAAFISLALDDGNQPRLVYFDSVYGELVHLQPSGQSWAAQQVVSLEAIRQAPSLVLGQNDRPYLAYGVDHANSGLPNGADDGAGQKRVLLGPYYFDVYYAHRAGGGWTTQRVASVNTNHGYQTTLALDGSDRPHLIYLASDTAVDLYYADRSDGQWRNEWLRTTIYGGSGALALDVDGMPHIVVDGPDYLRKAPDGRWLSERFGSEIGTDASIALDSQGRPHVLYYTCDEGVRYGWRDEAGWHLQTIAGAGRWCSLKLDAGNAPRFACQDDEGRLSFGVWTGSHGSLQMLDGVSGMKYGGAPALALDSAGMAHICYGEDSQGVLKYARQTESNWNVYAVDTDSFAPGLCSLALNADGLPIIAYLDRGTMDVKMATAAPLIDSPLRAAQHDPASLPDLTIEGMRIELETGGSCSFTSTQLGTRVRIANTGDADAGPFVLALNDEPYQIASGLPAGAEAEYWFPNAHYFMETVAIVDATHVIAESNEDNNEMRQMLGIPTLPATCTPAVTPSPTPSPTPSGTITPTPTPTSSHTPTLSPTPTPSPSPIATGDFWWRCDVSARDDSSGQPIAGAHVLAGAIGEDACTTDAQGGCSVRVLAHDTGRINLRVSAEGYQDFMVEYVGMFAPSWVLARLQPAPPTETPTSVVTFTPTPSVTPTVAAPPTETPTTTTDLYSVWLPLLLRFPRAPV